jgi:lipopolysaccharide/colanic/teichoic acid biosynthesis glycosyltransferase
MFQHESKLYPSGVAVTDFYREVVFPAKAKIDLDYFSRRTLVSDLGWILRAVWTIALRRQSQTALGLQVDAGRK